ncbi:MAG: DUF1573 domain-containing protein [Sedimentisphaerales bacterium]|jgi:hypothetical protein
MRRTVLFCFVVACILCGCNDEKEYVKTHGMGVGYVAGPFFHYGQTKLSETRHFNLGDIPREGHTIIASISFTNSGWKTPLIIEKVDCNCPCFAGWDGDDELVQQQKGEIAVYFDKDKIESGPTSIPVIIKTNDPSNSKVKIFFDFNVVQSREEKAP